MAGAALVAAGLAGLGRYTGFVSYSVMIGFLTGISVNIAYGQVADLTGAEAHGAFPLAKAAVPPSAPPSSRPSPTTPAASPTQTAGSTSAACNPT